MDKIKTLDDLIKLRNQVQKKVKIREEGDDIEHLPQVQVAMGTCGIAAGAREIMNFFLETLESKEIEATVTHTGCMGYCYAEPTVKVTLPNKEPLIFGNVTTERALKIIDEYIVKGDLVDGILPDNAKPLD